MAIRAVIFLLLLFGVAAFSASADRPSSEKTQPSKAEIEKLILNLGHANFQVREKAMKRLEEIGKPALDPLYEAQKQKNSEISQRAELLIIEIEGRMIPSKTVSGMQFRLLVDKKWSIPKEGEKNNFSIHLEIKNVGKKVYRIFPSEIHAKLTNAKGITVLSRAGAGGSVPAWCSPPLKENDIFLIELKASIKLNLNDLEFWLSDPFETYWRSDNLCKGTYNIWIFYRNSSEYLPGSRGPLWVGEVETFHHKVEIQ